MQSGQRGRLATTVDPEHESRWIRTRLRGWWGSHQRAPLEPKGRARTGLQGEAARGGNGGREEKNRTKGIGAASVHSKGWGRCVEGAARQGEGGGSTAGGGQGVQSGGVGTCHLPFPARRSWKWLGGRGGGARLEKPHGPAPSGGNACQGGRARGEVCGMVPRLARGSKRRAWTLISQRRQYQVNHLRHRAEKRGLSGGDGRRGACEWSCEATMHAWRVSSAVWSAPCRRGVELV